MQVSRVEAPVDLHAELKRLWRENALLPEYPIFFAQPSILATKISIPFGNPGPFGNRPDPLSERRKSHSQIRRNLAPR